MVPMLNYDAFVTLDRENYVWHIKYYKLAARLIELAEEEMLPRVQVAFPFLAAAARVFPPLRARAERRRGGPAAAPAGDDGILYIVGQTHQWMDC